LLSVLSLLSILTAGFPLRIDGEAIEYQVKAAYLLNFIRFTEWPSNAFMDAESPFTICVLGEDPFGSTLDQILSGETVNGRKVQAKRIKNAPGSGACQVLYIAEPAKNPPPVGPGVLTVGEGQGFVKEGGIIAFVLDNRRVRFGINQTAAAGAGLKLSARLLNVAGFVEK
jgi:hypothetical protein